MIFPILYFQYIRIKFISSIFTRRSFNQLDKNILEAYLPGAIYSSFALTWMKQKLLSFVDFEKNNTKKASEEIKDQSFRGDDQKSDSQAEYIKSFQQGAQGSQKKSKARNGQASSRVHMGGSSADPMGEEQQNNSQRVFAAMMSEKNFKTNFNFNMDGFKKDDSGPTVEEVGDEDLD